MIKRSLSVLALLLVLPAAAHAQSLFGTRGLGVPLEGVDARARALGVSGVGLIGLSTTMVNPAEAAGLVRRGFSASFQPWGGNVELNGASDAVAGTRFPLFEVLYPTRRFSFSLGYSSMFDQSWALTTESDVYAGTDTLAVSDLVRTRGGIGQFKFGVARILGPGLAVGASIGVHTGNVDRIITRQFVDSTFTGGNFTNRARWDYNGPTAAIGVRWDASVLLRVAGSLTWSGTLDANPKEGSTTSYEYDMPLRMAVGASAQLSSKWMATASILHSRYGSGSYAMPGSDVPTVADNTTDIGAGLEYQGLRTSSRVFPIRAGFRSSTLPFHATGDDAAKEWAVSGGIGLRLVEDDYGPLAVADLAFEKGNRSGWSGALSSDGLTEDFWRATVTVSLFGR